MCYRNDSPEDRMPRPKKLPMPQDVGQHKTHITLRIAAFERDLLARATAALGGVSMSDFVRQAIVDAAERVLTGPTAADRLAAVEEEQADLYAFEPPPFTPPAALSDILGVPLFPQPATVASRDSSRVEAVGLDEPMDGWL